MGGRRRPGARGTKAVSKILALNGGNRNVLGTIMNVTIYLLILIAAFVGIVVWAFSRKRKARFEKDAQIPFEDGDG